MAFSSSFASDRGLVREENEDRALCDDKLGLYGVADGIGGLPYGERAANLAMEEFTRHLPAEAEVNAEKLTRALLAVNESILQLGKILSPLRGLGTTFCAGILRANTLLIGNLGDSRAYLVSKGQISQITTDHNLGNEAAARRARGEFVALTERTKGALTRCLGQLSVLEVDVFPVELQAGDRVLFCTDGIYRSIPDAELLQLLSSESKAEKLTAQLVELSKERGGYDNATAVLLIAN